MIYTSEPNISKTEKLFINKSLKRGLISSFGKDIVRFENKFSKLYKFRYSLALNSGTSALHIALLSNGVKKDDLVIVPNFSFAATINSVIYCGAQPWFHDTCKKNFLIDIEQVNKSLKENTFLRKGERFHNRTKQRVSCIIPVTSFGNSINFSEIIKLKRNFNIEVVIDGAAAHFAKFKGEALGKTNLDFIFSFNGNKGFSTGSGGMYCTTSQKKINTAKILINVGQQVKKYNYKVVGFNYRMNNIQANLGLAQLSRYKFFLSQKKKIYDFYKKNIKTDGLIKNFFHLSVGSGYFWVYPIIVKKNKKKFLSFLKKKKIYLTNFWKTLSKQKPYKNYLYENLENSEKFSDQLVCLPSSTFLTEQQLKKIVKCINNFK